MAQTTLESRGSLAKRKILVVDDVMLNRRLLGKLVESLGYDPLYSSDGAEAIDQYQQLRTADDLFCILMDVQMPRVDGLEATKEIRSLEAAAAAAVQEQQQERPACSDDDSSCSAASCAEGLGADEEPPTPCSRRVPIVGVSACTAADQLKSAALTGLSFDTATERPWEVVGMDLFLAKPIGRDKLAAALETIREAQAWSAFERSAAQRASQPLRQPSMPAGGAGGGSLGTAGSGGSSSCGSFTSLSAGLDIQVRSRPGGQQVAQRSLGGCMQMGALLGGGSSSDEEPAAKRPRVSRLGQPAKPAADESPAACDVPAA